MISNWFQAYDPKDKVQLKRWTGETAAKAEIEKWMLK
jgi:inorganic pyrophosphatase